MEIRRQCARTLGKEPAVCGLHRPQERAATVAHRSQAPLQHARAETIAAPESSQVGVEEEQGDA